MKYLKLLAILNIFLFFIACEADDSDFAADILDVNNFVHDCMHDYYLWNDELDVLNVYDFNAPQELVDSMSVDLDKWSFIDKAETVASLFDEGEDFGFGFFISWDTDKPDLSSSIRVMFVYENAEAYKKGIRRGWNLLEIDGVSIFDITSFASFSSYSNGTMTFKFKNEKGQDKEITLSKESYLMNGILSDTIYDIGGKDVGYMAYQSFLGYSEEELIRTIQEFKSNNIDELIVDLRFNQGGYVYIAEMLSDILVPPAKVGAEWITHKFNNDLSQYDSVMFFEENSNNLNLERIFFITNGYSASASELVINGLQPHSNIITIGESTYGKPVGMSRFAYEDWWFYPVTFKSVNANGVGDYYEGIKPDYYVFDNYHYDWADKKDPAIATALSIIETGSASIETNKTSLKTTQGRTTIKDKRLNRNFLIK